MDKSRDHDLPR